MRNRMTDRSFAASRVLSRGAALAALLTAGLFTPRSATAASPVVVLEEYLRLTELMYAPVHPTSPNDFEFLEFKNISPNTTLDLSGLRFTSGITYTFPNGTTIPPGGFLLLTRTANADQFRDYYNVPDDNNIRIVGPYSGQLSNQGEEIVLENLTPGSVLFRFEYEESREWPQAADSGGHSLVPRPETMADQLNDMLDFGLNWTASVYMNGSPGQDEPPRPPSPVINEFDSHTDPPPPYNSNDWVELYNPTDFPIQLDGNWYLSDNVERPDRFRLPVVTIPPKGYLVLEQILHNIDFGFDKAGEQVVLSHLPGGAQNRIVDCTGYEGQERGWSIGRYPDGGEHWVTMPLTPGGPNKPPRAVPVITEVMYRPATEDITREYIEIFNPTHEPVDLWTDDQVVRPWQISGEVDYIFPLGTTLQPGETILIVPFNPASTIEANSFRNKYGVNPAVRLFGPWVGDLGNRTGRITLEKGQDMDPPMEDPLNPGTLLANWIVVDEMYYFDRYPFDRSADGGGTSLQRREALVAGTDPANWQALAPNPGVGIDMIPEDRTAADRDWLQAR